MLVNLRIDFRGNLCDNKTQKLQQAKGEIYHENEIIRGGKLSHVVAVALCCVLLAGCSNIKNPAKAPFSAKDCAGMTSEKVMTDLQKAGFTNVTVVDEETTSKSSDGIVVSVSVDGKTDFKKNAKWEDDVPVEITAYKLKQLDVTMKVSERGETGKPVFLVQTNLPDGLKLNFKLENENGYSKEQDARIENGKAESQPFTDNGAELKGNYTLTATMTLDGQGLFAPMASIGNGDVLAGDLVSVGGNGRPQVSTKYSYTSGFEPAISEEEMVALLETMLANDSGMSYEVTPYDDGYIVDTWTEGVADGAAYAKLGISPYKEMWKQLTQNAKSYSSSLMTLMSENGYGDKHLLFNLINDQDPDKLDNLITIKDGIMTYNYVS